MHYELDYEQLLDPYYMRRLLGGIETTVILFLICLVAGILIGIVLTAARTVPFRPLQVLVAAFIEFQRNVPLLVHLLIWYFGIASVLPQAVTGFTNRHGTEFVYAAIALSLYTGAFMSEELRSGLRAIPKTQYESARAIGLSLPLILRLVIIPQAIRNSLPPIVGQTLSLYKNTSIAAAIGTAELMYRSREFATETFRVFEIFSVATVIYIAGSIIVVVAGYGLTEWLRIPGEHDHVRSHP